MSTKRKKSCYRELQAIAKQLQLPGNVKILQQMVQARNEGNESLVQRMISEIERAKMQRRAEKYEARQVAYTQYKTMVGREVVKQEGGHSNEEAMSDAGIVGVNDARVNMNRNQQSKNGTVIGAYIRSLLLLPQEKRIEMIRRKQEFMTDISHQMTYEPYPRSQCNTQHQFTPCCSSSEFRLSPLQDNQVVASPDQEFREYCSRNQSQQCNENFRANYSFEPNGNYSAEPLNPNHFSSRAQELIVPFSEPTSHCVEPHEQIYEESILPVTEEVYEHSSTTTGMTQMTRSPDSDTLSSDETRAVSCGSSGVNAAVSQYQPAVQVEYRNDTQMSYVVEEYCQDYAGEVQEILSDQSDSDALQINSSIESQMDSYSDVGEEIPPFYNNYIQL